MNVTMNESRETASTTLSDFDLAIFDHYSPQEKQRHHQQLLEPGVTYLWAYVGQ